MPKCAASCYVPRGVGDGGPRGEREGARWYRDEVRIAGLLLSGRDETLF